MVNGDRKCLNCILRFISEPPSPTHLEITATPLIIYAVGKPSDENHKLCWKTYRVPIVFRKNKSIPLYYYYYYCCYDILFSWNNSTGAVVVHVHEPCSSTSQTRIRYALWLHKRMWWWKRDAILATFVIRLSLYLCIHTRALRTNAVLFISRRNCCSSDYYYTALIVYRVSVWVCVYVYIGYDTRVGCA